MMMISISRILPFSSSTTYTHALTYLLVVCLFSISFLVFLNASISFVITDLIGEKNRIGELVGTLGFADELIALLACPFWGILSDRLGVRYVCVAGYSIISISLFILVQARNVYPQLLLARILFSIGAAASTTMVTSILPALTCNDQRKVDPQISDSVTQNDDSRSSIPSCSYSQITITPANFKSRSQVCLHKQESSNFDRGSSSSPSRLAGLVGLFTGCGALVALIIFLPLPAQFNLKGLTHGQAVADSFYVVGTISLAVACACFFGLRGLHGEEAKGWHLLLHGTPSSKGYEPLSEEQNEVGAPNPMPRFLPYWQSLRQSIILGFTDAQIGLGYLGGFVARASSVGISLFIPLHVNAFYIRNGFCQISPTDPSSDLKRECRAAYVLASELTGVSQLVALLCAPIFGYLSDRYRCFNWPLLAASGCGIVGYTAFAHLMSPEAQNINSRGGGPLVFLIVSLIGISQIGAIVCSLGLLGQGVLSDSRGPSRSSQHEDIRNSRDTKDPADSSETLPLVNSPLVNSVSRSHLKGSIAGVYSLSGGAAILILTKLGGYLFDNLSSGAPFYIMAIFNILLLLVGGGICTYRKILT